MQHVFVWNLETVWGLFVLSVLAALVVGYVLLRATLAVFNRWRR